MVVSFLGNFIYEPQSQKTYFRICAPRKDPDQLVGDSSKIHLNIGIKHGFSCINIRQVPWEVLKTEAGGRGFQHLPRDLANAYALKNHVRSLLLHKKLKTFATFRVISCTIFFCLFTDVSRTQLPRIMLVLGPAVHIS